VSSKHPFATPDIAFFLVFWDNRHRSDKDRMK
jgi:hypothetical protein